MVELFIAQCHGAGHIQILYGGGDKSIGVGAHGIAKDPPTGFIIILRLSMGMPQAIDTASWPLLSPEPCTAG